jgi:hypothetical protein
MSHSTAHSRSLIALLLTAVMLLVQAVKVLHTHELHQDHHSLQKEIGLSKDDGPHGCSICEFQLTKDATVAGSFEYAILTNFTSVNFSQLLTTLHADYIYLPDNRGPPLS